MKKGLISKAKLTAIADAIRNKTGETDSYTLAQMVEKIAGLSPAELPELANPAAEKDVLAGKEYIDGSGAKKAGTLVVCDTVQEVETFGLAGTGVHLDIESTADASGKTMTLPEKNLLPENIKSGVRIFAVAGSVKEIRTETGTITLAEDVIDITIPAPFDGYCALLLIAVDRSALEEKGANSIYNVRVMHALDDGIGAIGVANRYNGSTYSAATKIPMASDDGNIYIGGTAGRYYRAGIVYNYYVYYWEDT